MMKIVAVLVVLAAAVSARSPAVLPLGIVEGIEDCGSVGQILAVGVTDCTKVPCELTPGRTYEIDIDFISTVGMFQINLKVNALVDGVVHNLFDVPVEGNVKPNEPYNLNLGLPVTSQFSGKSIKIELQLWHYETGEMEICASAAANIA